MQDPKNHHHRTNLSGYIFATKARIDNRKNLLNSNVSSTCPHNMVNFSPLAAEICWWVLSTPANFNRFRVFAALLHGTLVMGVSHTLRRWTESATYIRQGGHHVWHWPTFLVVYCNAPKSNGACDSFWCWRQRYTLFLFARLLSCSFARFSTHVRKTFYV